MPLGPQIIVEYHMPGVDHKHTVVVEGDGSIAGSGGVLFTSDDMGSWDARQLERFRAAVNAFRRHNNV